MEEPKSPINETPKSYIHVFIGSSNSSKIDLSKIPIVDVPLPLKQPQYTDWVPTVKFTNLELQKLKHYFSLLSLPNLLEEGLQLRP